MKHSVAVIALLVIAVPAVAQQPADKPLEGYACALLNATEAQLRDPQWPGQPILTAPDASAPRGTMASAIVIVRDPAHVVGGFAEVMQRTGKPGWIEASKLAPYRSRSDAHAKCTPAILGNGRIGTL